MAKASFDGVSFEITHTVEWTGRRAVVELPWQPHFDELLKRFGDEEQHDLVVPGRTTLAFARSTSIERGERQEKVTVVFHEDPDIPTLVKSLSPAEKALWYGASRALPSFIFLTAAETDGRRFLGEVPDLVGRVDAEVALLAVAASVQIILLLGGLLVHRHLARQSDGQLCWLYTTEPEVPVAMMRISPPSSKH